MKNYRIGWTHIVCGETFIKARSENEACKKFHLIDDNELLAGDGILEDGHIEFGCIEEVE